MEREAVGERVRGDDGASTASSRDLLQARIACSANLQDRCRPGARTVATHGRHRATHPHAPPAHRTSSRRRPSAPLPRPEAAGAVIDFEDVVKRYPSGDLGLNGATFAIHPGEFVFIVGASGSGKSTLMRLLIKEVEPTTGHIRVAGHDLAEIPRNQVPYYRRNIGMVHQDFKLLPNRTVADNVAYALQVTGGSRRDVRDKVPDILRLTGLSLKLHSYPDQLSGGEQQRVSVARAFVNHPPLLLADEPTGNLDPETSVGIMQLLYRINSTGTTVVVVTHDHQMVDRMRRRVIELSKGKVIRDERSAGYTRPTTEMGDPAASGPI